MRTAMPARARSETLRRSAAARHAVAVGWVAFTAVYGFTLILVALS